MHEAQIESEIDRLVKKREEAASRGWTLGADLIEAQLMQLQRKLLKRMKVRGSGANLERQ